MNDNTDQAMKDWNHIMNQLSEWMDQFYDPDWKTDHGKQHGIQRIQLQSEFFRGVMAQLEQQVKEDQMVKSILPQPMAELTPPSPDKENDENT